MLIKFGQKEHMESLLDGNIYMNSMEFFKHFEDCSNIGDRDEGVSEILQSEFIDVIIEPRKYEKDGEIIKTPKHTLSKKNGFLNIKLNQDNSHINLFCLYLISRKQIAENNLKFILPKEIKEDKNYEYCVIFFEAEEIRNKILEGIKNRGYDLLGCTNVQYEDKKTYHGEMGIFKKFKEYEYQNEYRIAIVPTKDSRGKDNEISFNIGSIRSIAGIFKTNEIEEIIKIGYNG